MARGRDWSEYERAYYILKNFLHGRRLGNKPSRLITGSMNFNAAFTSTWVFESASDAASEQRSPLFFLVFFVFFLFFMLQLAVNGAEYRDALSGAVAVAPEVRGITTRASA